MACASHLLHASQASKAFTDNKDELLQLWCHEAERVIGDRMWDPADKQWLRKQLDERLGAAFSTSVSGLFEATSGEVGGGDQGWADGGGQGWQHDDGEG